jgi:hypothetical protein
MVAVLMLPAAIGMRDSLAAARSTNSAPAQ